MGSYFGALLRCPCSRPAASAYLKRLTLVVRDGRLVRVFFPVHPPDKHAGEVLSWLRAES